MFLIGLTGGIASGKTVVAQRLQEHGAVVVDADVLARQVVEPGTPALARIAEVFGDTVIAADGSLDRAALGAIVFSSPPAREKLESITHPAVREHARSLFAAADAADPNAIVVYDVPLLAEASAGRDFEFDLVVVVHASKETRIDRMVNLRGMSRQEAEGRINSQASDEVRLALADVVIDSDGTLEHTLAQADALWASVSASAHSKQGS